MKKFILCTVSTITLLVSIPLITVNAANATRFITIWYNNGKTMTAINIDTASDEEVASFNDEVQQCIDFYTNRVIELRKKNNELLQSKGDVNDDGETGLEDAQIILAYYTEKNVAGKDVPDITEFAKNYGKQ